MEKIEEAKKLIEEVEKENQKKCYEELQEVLKKYGYNLQVTQPQTFLTKVQ